MQQLLKMRRLWSGRLVARSKNIMQTRTEHIEADYTSLESVGASSAGFIRALRVEEDMNSRITRAWSRAKYAAIFAAIGAGLGGLFGRSMASSGAAVGALLGATIGEKRVTSSRLGETVKDRVSGAVSSDE